MSGSTPKPNRATKGFFWGMTRMGRSKGIRAAQTSAMPSRDWGLTLVMPTEALRDQLATALMEGIAATRTVPDIQFRDVMPLYDSDPPAIHLTIRAHRALAITDMEIAAQVAEAVRGYVGKVDTQGMTIAVNPISHIRPSPASSISPALAPGVTIPPGADTSLQAALRDAGQRSGQPPENLLVIEVAARAWGASGLGCPLPEGVVVAPAVFEGYLIRIRGVGRILEYHSAVQSPHRAR